MDKPVTLIIGLGRTVGEAVAIRMLDESHTVIAVDPDQSLLDDLQKSSSDKVNLHHGVIHTRLGLRNAMAATLEQNSRIDNVISIPALPDADRLSELDIEAFEVALLSSVRAAVQTLQVFSPVMIEQGQDVGDTANRLRQAGSFTFILSLGAVMSQPGWFSESVTQQAVLGVVRAAALELAPFNIRVNAVVALRPRAEGKEPWLKDRTPTGRTALAEEIAETALFLSSPASAIITGEAIVLDGGRSQLSGLIESADV